MWATGSGSPGVSVGALLAGLLLGVASASAYSPNSLSWALLLEHQVGLEVHARDDLLLGLLVAALALGAAIARSLGVALGGGLAFSSGLPRLLGGGLRSGGLLLGRGSSAAAGSLLGGGLLSGRLLGSGRLLLRSGLLSRRLFRLGLAFAGAADSASAPSISGPTAALSSEGAPSPGSPGAPSSSGRVGVAFLVEHQASTSMGSGCCAACGWSGPAYTFSLRSWARPSRVRGSIPFTASRMTSSGRRVEHLLQRAAAQAAG